MDRPAAAALSQSQARGDELRRRLLGVDFSEVQVERVLGAGCNGAVFIAVVHGVHVALKVMYNFGAETTMVGNLFRTEYRFLRLVPHHPNIVSVLGVIKAAPLTPAIVELLPEAARDAAAPRNRRGRVRYLPTAGMFMELLPLTLEAYLDARGADLTQAEVVSIGTQVACAVSHLYSHGVVHGDIQLNNLMVDLGAAGGGGGAARDAVAAAAGAATVRVVLVDFGCAAAQGTGQADMDDQMRVSATVATNFALGNQSHLAPEVLDAFARKGRLPRHSREEVVIPLAHQPSFALGVILYEIGAGEHPMPGYPTVVGDMASAFDSIDYDDVRKLAGTQYADVVLGLLQFEPQARLPVDNAWRRLAALRSCVCPSPVNGPAHDAGADVGERLPPAVDRELEVYQATIASLQEALEEQRVAAQQAEERAAQEREARERELAGAQAALELQRAALEEQRIAARKEAEARELAQAQAAQQHEAAVEKQCIASSRAETEAHEPRERRAREQNPKQALARRTYRCMQVYHRHQRGALLSPFISPRPHICPKLTDVWIAFTILGQCRSGLEHGYTWD